jgi:hypothetical protein
VKESAAISQGQTLEQAEQIAWQQIETLLLDHCKHQTPLSQLIMKKRAEQQEEKG